MTAQQRRAAAFNAVGPTLQAHDRSLPLSVRRAIADAVLAAIQPYTEHCTHSVHTHHAHHHQPVTGCPWCTEDATRPTTVPTRGLL